MFILERLPCRHQWVRNMHPRVATMPPRHQIPNRFSKHEDHITNTNGADGI
jgi:hypothetical protein